MPNAPEVKFKDKLVNNLDEKNTQDQWTPEELQETNEELEEQNTSLESPEATDKPEEPELDENGKPRRKLNKKAYMCGIVLLLMFFAIAIYRTHTNGFGMIVQTVESYTYNVETLETPASFTINLDNLESNSGVSVYDDGDCSIEVSSVRRRTMGTWSPLWRRRNTTSSKIMRFLYLQHRKNTKLFRTVPHIWPS